MIRRLLALALVSTGLAAATTLPAEAGKGSAIRSWKTTSMTVTPHARKTFKLRVKTPGGPVKRVVRLQVRFPGQTKWRPGPKQKTDQRGKVRYHWQAPLYDGAYQVRVVSPKRGKASRAVSAVRKVTVRDPLSGVVAALVTEVNKARASARDCHDGSGVRPAVPALAVDSRLAAAAKGHAQDMADKDYFSHFSLDGRSPQDRARAAGYTGLVGENIAASTSAATAAAVMSMWLNSPGHCSNVMSAGYRTVGFGHGFQPDSRYRNYWVQVFGSR